MGHSHRSGSLKQVNKKHKVKNLSNRAVKAKLGNGRIEKKKNTKSESIKSVAIAGRQQRMNQMKQGREKKREALWLQKRLGGGTSTPKVAMWVSLVPETDCHKIQSIMTKQCLVANSAYIHRGIPAETVSMSTVKFDQYHQRVTFMHPKRDAMTILELAKVADIVLLVLPVHTGMDNVVDQEGDTIISLLKAQGLPSIVGIIHGLDSLKNPNNFRDMKSYGQRFFTTEFGADIKIAESNSEVQLVRAIMNAPMRTLHWRANRSYFIADHAEFEPSDSSFKADQYGNLKIKGHIRGKPLGVNQLIHLCGVGAFQLLQINSSTEPCPMRPIKNALTSTLDHQSEVLCIADSTLQESLKLEADVDTLAGEQTWPTKEELGDIEESNENDINAIKPKGWSTYQNSWLESTHNNDKSDQQLMDGSNSNESEDLNNEDWANDSNPDNTSVTESNMDCISENTTNKKEKMEDEDKEFPDEVNTPEDIPARKRFDRYRALKSFRSSPWDPKESLPADYARIYQFDNFLSVQKSVLREGDVIEKNQNSQLIQQNLGNDSKIGSSRSRASSFAQTSNGPMDADNIIDSVNGNISLANSSKTTILGRDGFLMSGSYVELVLGKVPKNILENRELPLIGFSLLQFEQKLSVLQFQVVRSSNYQGTIASKDRLIVQCGFRKWNARPIFSQINLNCDKHKFERFLVEDRFSGASVYGPATYQPAPVLLFKESFDELGNSPIYTLVATGTLLGVDPDRIILKKVILTGYPLRVHKRKAVVKYMFNFQEDVKWFKPAELITKYGLTGHIREAVGTHGLMKVMFNKHIKQNDTVCLPLYKRVYPKFDGDRVTVI